MLDSSSSLSSIRYLTVVGIESSPIIFGCVRNGIGNGRRARYVSRCSRPVTNRLQDTQVRYKMNNISTEYKNVFTDWKFQHFGPLLLPLFLYKNTQRREENHQIIEVMTYAKS